MDVISFYIAWLAAAGLTIWVGWTLRKNGRVFLLDAFRGNAALADSVNRPLAIGFYLVTAGCWILALWPNPPFGAFVQAIYPLSHEAGIVLIVLGITIFLHICILSRVRTRVREQARPNASESAPS